MTQSVCIWKTFMGAQSHHFSTPAVFWRKISNLFLGCCFFCVCVRVISNLEEFMKLVPPTSSVHRWGCNPWWKTCFYNFLSFPAATVGALTEAIKTVCSDNGCMNVFRGGSLELDGVICRFVCLAFLCFLIVLLRSILGPILKGKF